MPRGCNDDEMALVREAVILPAIAQFAPDAIVLQCGADAVLEDPQSRMALSNNAHWAVVAALRDMSPRYLVMGGGGYNPWSVGRLWTGVWATLNGKDIPDVLPTEAQDVLRNLSWKGPMGEKFAEAHWLTTLRDPPRIGPISMEVTERIAQIAARLPLASSAP